jgi:sulfatase modifying factor 1
VREALETMYYPVHERFYRKREFDTRKLMFEYYWIDYKKAASKANRFDFETGKYMNGIPDRSAFIVKDVLNIYPDTLCWVHDFTYSFNEPMTNAYFWHPAYDNYPVVGVSWKQARAFCIWRTQLLNTFLSSRGEITVQDFRLPTESEWEWAARGGLDLSPYPWGGPYIRNSNGCFLGNFKPLRGNYIDDGGFHSLVVGHFAPNDFGLYDMGGNVAEWTSNAFDESAYNFAHDLNMDYSYEAKKDDLPALKRKVIRGGSWKDVGYFLQVSTRSYEYQDTAKCYVGFRCVQSYLGRSKGDGPSASNVYN